MSNLDTQTKNFNIIISCEKYDVSSKILNDLTSYFDRCTYFYALICHDRDIDKNGVLKNKHFHIVLKCASRYRLSTMLYKIADCLHLYDSKQLSSIQIDKCDSLPLSIQYLTHKNNLDKFQYNFNDIITNFSDKDINDFYNTQCDKEINTQYLIELVANGYTDFEILALIGVGRYHLYKGAIQDIRYAYSHTPNKVNQFLESVSNDGNK